MPCEKIGGGRFSYEYDGRVFAPSTDSFLLASFAKPRRGDAVADLGAGAGLLSLLLAARDISLRFLLIDKDAHAVSLAKENFLRNGQAARAAYYTADVRLRAELPPVGSADYAVANPPYFSETRGKGSPDPARRTARTEDGCTVDELAAAAKYLLRAGGRFALVHRADRMADVFAALRAHGLEPKRLRLFQHSAASAPSLFLTEAVSGGRPGLLPEPTLIRYDADGGETADYRRVYEGDDGK